MKFGVAFPTDLSEITQWAKIAETEGFETIWVQDPSSLKSDVYVTLTFIALNTSRIKLGPGVTNPVTRHPAITANAISTIDQVSGGRAVLGIGTGDASVRVLNMPPASLEYLEESIFLIRKFLAGEEAHFRGERITPQQRRKIIPIYISALGPRMLQLAGRVADGVMVSTGIAPPLVEYALENIRKGAERAGRTLRDIDIGWWTSCSLAPDIKEAEDEVRPWVAITLHNYARLGQEVVPRELAEAIQVFSRAGAGTADHGTFALKQDSIKGVTSEIINKFAIIGNAEECVEKLNRLRRYGINKVHFTLYTTRDRPKFLRDFSRKVMSSFTQ